MLKLIIFQRCQLVLNSPVKQSGSQVKRCRGDNQGGLRGHMDPSHQWGRHRLHEYILGQVAVFSIQGERAEVKFHVALRKTCFPLPTVLPHSPSLRGPLTVHLHVLLGPRLVTKARGRSQPSGATPAHGDAVCPAGVRGPGDRCDNSCYPCQSSRIEWRWDLCNIMRIWNWFCSSRAAETNVFWIREVDSLKPTSNWAPAQILTSVTVKDTGLRENYPEAKVHDRKLKHLCGTDA